MNQNLNLKVKEFVNEVTKDKRWDIDSQTMFDTFALTLSGYAYGIGRNFWFLDDETISTVLFKELTTLGAGEKYVKGLIEFALSTFKVETKNYQSELVGIGFFKFSDSNFDELKECIFENAQKIEKQLANPKIEMDNKNTVKNKKWWEFWK